MESKEILDSYLDLLITKDKFPCDVTFVVGLTKEKISCHKIFLTARSPVFETMFADRWASANEIELPDVEPHVFQMFLEYLYAGKTSDGVVPVNISDIEMLMYLAEKYTVSSVMDKFEEMLKPILRVENVHRIQAIANRYNLPALGSATAEFSKRKFSELIFYPNFDSMDKDLLQICVKDCHEMKEIHIFNGIMKWAEARCQESGVPSVGPNIRKVLKGILPHIRFPRMTIQEFRSVVVPREILTPAELLDVYDHLARDTSGRSQYKTGIFSSEQRVSPFALDRLKRSLALRLEIVFRDQTKKDND